jgi:predicted DNA-binding protein (UPF0251 family)
MPCRKRWRRRLIRELLESQDSENLVAQLIPAPVRDWNPVELSLEELQVLKLVDYEGLTQVEASERLGISRATVWRLLKSGRQKLLQAILEGRPLKIVKNYPEEE